MRLTHLILVAAGCGLAPALARGQTVPFFAGGNTAFDPEVSVVNSGAVLDAQAVVSQDRRYVTINARTENSTLLALRTFSFASGGNQPALGFVGGAGQGNGAAAAAGSGNALDRRGVTLVTPLD
jgi:hypothetical protein